MSFLQDEDDDLIDRWIEDNLIDIDKFKGFDDDEPLDDEWESDI